MITINSNSSALMAQNNLFNAQSALTGNMQQLSTGLRINSASDDAAGLQISNRMETQMNGLSVAQRNANDGISMAQTAEGAMTENTTILNRMRDLSLQSANDTNTLEDRQAMQKEVNSLVAEVDRIASTTNFAGINLLDGTADNLSFQIGSNAGETIQFGIADMSASALTGDVTSINFDMSDLTFTDGDLVIDDGTDENATIAVTVNDGADDLAEVTLTQGDSIEDVAQALNDGLNSQGVTFAVEEGALKAFSMNEKFGETDDGEGGTNPAELTLQVGGADATATGGTSPMSLEDINITTAQGAQQAVQILDGALAKVDDQRANLGAVQNRLESTISNLSNIEENLGVSQSRILDADFASQTVEMTSNQMLMQAGTSVLAQAKGMPQYATMLL
ncbi:hypothetical protein GZ77_06235 [Endozoicomonas montiporae]|uniref:Flagellin n=2 Tax=Endozoicomonas montiporae TaxID=1027273 RepID=A0A081NC85_9GAMM|nr:flagellin [Endozoicomonas montiporae]AMO56391.1 flagellin C [Endozoicomonas montiporae CL-33]KEQ16058.1 hypothetical protein GZ77_06235 [Endozoicomonas montiporae]